MGVTETPIYRYHHSNEIVSYLVNTWFEIMLYNVTKYKDIELESATTKDITSYDSGIDYNLNDDTENEPNTEGYASEVYFYGKSMDVMLSGSMYLSESRHFYEEDRSSQTYKNVEPANVLDTFYHHKENEGDCNVNRKIYQNKICTVPSMYVSSVHCSPSITEPSDKCQMGGTETPICRNHNSNEIVSYLVSTWSEIMLYNVTTYKDMELTQSNTTKDTVKDITSYDSGIDDTDPESTTEGYESEVYSYGTYMDGMLSDSMNLSKSRHFMRKIYPHRHIKMQSLQMY